MEIPAAKPLADLRRMAVTSPNMVHLQGDPLALELYHCQNQISPFLINSCPPNPSPRHFRNQDQISQFICNPCLKCTLGASAGFLSSMCYSFPFVYCSLLTHSHTGPDTRPHFQPLLESTFCRNIWTHDVSKARLALDATSYFLAAGGIQLQSPSILALRPLWTIAGAVSHLLSHWYHSIDSLAKINQNF